MAEKKLDVHLNGTNELARNKDSEPARLWRQIELNERSCSFLLFVMSLSIVLGKLYVNYGERRPLITLFVRLTVRVVMPARINTRCMIVCTFVHISMLLY